MYQDHRGLTVPGNPQALGNKEWPLYAIPPKGPRDVPHLMKLNYIVKEAGKPIKEYNLLLILF